VSKRVMAMLVGVAALAMLVAGCGGSEEEESLTKAEFIKQGDKICKTSSDEILSGYSTFTKQHKIKEFPNRAQGYEITEQIYIPSVEKRLEALRALNPPPADQKQVEAILAPAEKGVVMAKKDVKAVFTKGDTPFDESNKLAVKYGFKVCGTI
jgi:hypothetical protein